MNSVLLRFELRQALKIWLLLLCPILLAPLAKLLDHFAFQSEIEYATLAVYLLALLTLLMAIRLGGSAFIQEHQDGALEYLLAMPIAPANLWLHKSGPRLLVLIGQLTLFRLAAQFALPPIPQLAYKQSWRSFIEETWLWPFPAFEMVCLFLFCYFCLWALLPKGEGLSSLHLLSFMTLGVAAVALHLHMSDWLSLTPLAAQQFAALLPAFLWLGLSAASLWIGLRRQAPWTPQQVKKLLALSSLTLFALFIGPALWLLTHPGGGF